jgi:hypothetical protein
VSRLPVGAAAVRTTIHAAAPADSSHYAEQPEHEHDHHNTSDGNG